MKIILGSSSKGRQFVFTRAGYTFDTMAADIDEKAIRYRDLEKLPLLIARAKNEALLPLVKEPAILITVDSVAVFKEQLREKPESEEQAWEYLRSYAEAPVALNTGVVVTNTKTNATAEGTDVSRVHFKQIPDDVIEKLIAEGEIMNAAGAFKVEHPMLEPYVDHIEGTVESVMGLPIELTKKLMAAVE